MLRSEVLQSFLDMYLCGVSVCMHFDGRHTSRRGHVLRAKNKTIQRDLVLAREAQSPGRQCGSGAPVGAFDGLATDLCTREGAVESTDHEP